MWQTPAKLLAMVQFTLFLFSIGIIVAMHLSAAGWLSILRIPSYLGSSNSPILLGSRDPFSLLPYHLLLGLYFGIIVVNPFGLHLSHRPFWRRLATLSSVAGIVLFGGTFALFTYPLVSSRRHLISHADAETSRIYALLTLLLLLVEVAALVLVEKGPRKLDDSGQLSASPELLPASFERHWN